MAKKVLIMAGGTGGHIFPALAIAKKLEAQGCEIQWVGTKDRMEAQLVPQYGYKIHFIEIKGLVSKGAKAWLKAPWQIFKATLQARKIIKQYKPDLIIGTGGYVCGPVGVAAQLTRTPLIVCENNGVMGLTNKLLSKFADLVLFAYPLEQAKKAEYVVGQPLRQEFTELNPLQNLANLYTKAANEFKLLQSFAQQENIQVAKELLEATEYNCKDYHALYQSLSAEQQAAFNRLSFSQQPLNILAVGGSLGAQILNTHVAPAIKMLENKGIYTHTFQQVGKDNALKVNELITNLGLNQGKSTYVAQEFITNMVEKYLASDLIICRSGSMTVFEIASCNRPAIFVPLAVQKDQQQLHNAEYLAKEQAAKIILNKDFTAEVLADYICQLNYHELYEMAKRQTRLATPQATDKIIEFVKPYLAS
ncbi:undecaprenyldiphospho-muramoylpentapeptide beta-N-acetylglucosaminyltransferase [Psittacicella hinzii]|uniref:UDP-N-acetylglucosamine--N-acetylmuramyl-(pentapeptide) pyrophosphoryl-undecaprenol N-acetylglucosamine transferase n=1 Tax=Psittacicella hinzii TaxID=2028575 RepID=A0A3A1YRN0_9GAMM|nr:undecaprenyldiphospho-muramoylpentapeptide beta-N-acetylglucosaminyltransferase [Psittacicella hinzii]RIY38667.1 undecaprenyldiphospho-muramoylpentapeptide beta-N-acetylglucosaminyltransferase [Psittacicella hinzii]